MTEKETERKKETVGSLEWLNRYEEELRDMRHELHRYPELAMQEQRTSQYIVQKLKEFEIPCRMTGETGVIAGLTAGEDLPVFVVRAEMDALAIEEKTGLPFCSAYPGRMHACGHDANTAVLLCLAHVLSRNREKLRYNVRFIFEPAEETGEGAQFMLDHGALENPCPAGILIFHFANQETRAMEIQKSISTAAIGGLRVEIKGKASHFFQYEEGIDAMYAASRLVVAVREINDTFLGEHPFVLAFGCMQAGAGRNIVSDHAVLEGSLRTFSKKDFQGILAVLEKRIKEIEADTGAEIHLEVTGEIPPFVNDHALVEKGMLIGRKLFGDKCYLGEKPFLAADNAALYAEIVPGMRVVFLAGKEGEQAYPVHNPRFDIDEAVMLDAVKFLFAFLTKDGE